ncbi:hypothetical protein ACFQH3_10110 [Haladaptatus sp. GCM10025707]|uniref:hypothetical protein n=1 Tax=unclassified Haladaptatus TaxID=2622732 RepID=UPI0023E8AD6F|nr:MULTISPECIES: hypothetical protein [unclassified Haladaptatus]
MSDDVPDPDAVKRALRRLAFAPTVGASPTADATASESDAARSKLDDIPPEPDDIISEPDDALVRRGVAAVDDVEAAAEFFAAVPLNQFQAAVERCAATGDDDLAGAGRRAIETVRDFRRVANHFRSGRGIPLRRDAK